jgi:hypothetical protein
MQIRTVKDYDKRILELCKANGPKHEYPIIELGTPEATAWGQFFATLDHLPWAYQALLDKRIKSMTVPTQWPSSFDPQFVECSISWPKRLADERPRQTVPEIMNEMRERMTNPGDRRNVLNLPADAPAGADGRHPSGTILTNYSEAYRLYGRPVGRFEKAGDKYNKWGPPDRGPKPKHTETPESVRAKLGLTQEQWDALPDAS